ncbi:MAG: prolipoprotein diacylglyceryl transferase [Clostridia bacterium]|nr:prolipoprotein diacylglyceryl transferase [Clostridia bacterium]
MYPHNLLPEGWPIEVHLYGVLIAVGILAAFAIIIFYGRKLSVSEKMIDFIFFNGIASIAVGFGSAAVFQSFYDYIATGKFEFNGKITFIGGLIGGVICFLLVYLIFRKKCDGTLSQVISMLPCAILAGHGFGRLGCLFAGCCYGAETDSIFGVEFFVKHGHEYVKEGVTRHPTQLYEALFLFAMCAVCTWLLFRFKFRHNMSLYLVTYGIFRFLIEYLRADARGELVGGISPSQFWSIFMVLAGVALYFWLEYFWQKYPSAFPEAKEDKANK